MNCSKLRSLLLKSKLMEQWSITLFDYWVVSLGNHTWHLPWNTPWCRSKHWRWWHSELDGQFHVLPMSQPFIIKETSEWRNNRSWSRRKWRRTLRDLTSKCFSPPEEKDFPFYIVSYFITGLEKTRDFQQQNPTHLGL